MQFSVWRVVSQLGLVLGWLLVSMGALSAPFLGQDFPTLPKASYSLGTWELQPGPNARTYTRAELDALGLFSLEALLRWDGVLDLNAQWGPWVGDGIALDGRSVQGCVLILFNGHPLSPPSGQQRTTLEAFSIRRATRVDIFIGVASGLYGAQGCEVTVSIVDDGREPGFVLDASWEGLQGTKLSGMVRRELADLTMSAGVTYQLMEDTFSDWKSFRDLRDGEGDTAVLDVPAWLDRSAPRADWGFAPQGQAYAYDFYYRVEVGEFALSWNNSALSTFSARGLEPAFADYSDDFETSSQESLYMSYVTDAADGSWRFFWNLSYGLASISPETELRSAMSSFAPAFVFGDEKVLLLEEYMLWQLSSWASLFVGGGAGFGVVTPRTALLNEPLDASGALGTSVNIDDVTYPTVAQVSYRNLFGYGHLTFGDAEGPRLQVGGRFDSDSRDTLFLSPRLSAALPLLDDWTWTLAAELSERPVPLRQRYVGDVVERDGETIWARNAASDLKSPTFYQAESRLGTKGFTLKMYYREDQILQGVSPDFSALGSEFYERKTVGWSLEILCKCLNLNWFSSYRGWMAEEGSRSYGHRLISRTHLDVAGFRLAKSLWIQHGDTLASNPWSGGLQLALSRSLSDWYEGLRIWSRGYAELQKSRLSLQQDGALPLPLARVGGQVYGLSVGLELSH